LADMATSEKFIQLFGDLRSHRLSQDDIEKDVKEVTGDL